MAVTKRKRPAPGKDGIVRKSPARPQENSKVYLSAMECFTRNVKEMRTYLGWSQRRLAQEANVSQQWVNWCENHRETIGFSSMCWISEVLGMTIRSMLAPDAVAIRRARDEKLAEQRAKRKKAAVK